MRRRLFNIVAGLSLLAWVAVVGLWVQSYRHSSVFVAADAHKAVASIHGRLVIVSPKYYMDDFEIPASVARPEFQFDMDPWEVKLLVRATAAECRMLPLGIGVPRYFHSFPSTWILPYWLLGMIFGVLPGAWLAKRWGRRRKHHEGLCVKCGYDLRASRERCPECGMAIPAKVEAAI